MKKIQTLLFYSFLAPALIFMTGPVSHGATGTYIDCIHGCPDFIVCTNCCNEVFSSALSRCDANRDQCEALCPPGDFDCLDSCMNQRNSCLMQDRRDFDCPHWEENGRKSGPSLFFKGSRPLSNSAECV